MNEAYARFLRTADIASWRECLDGAVQGLARSGPDRAGVAAALAEVQRR